MIYSYRWPIIWLIALFCLSLAACSSTNSDLIQNDTSRNLVNVIVLMPVENKTKDTKVEILLKARLMEELRFKGYPQTAESVDNGKAKPETGSGEGRMFLKNISAVQGADAAMYCTLQESKSSTIFFYSPATVAVRCELRSTKTGDTIWNAQYRSTSRSFNVMNSALKSSGALESALEEAVGKVMETFPYGPILRG